MILLLGATRSREYLEIMHRLGWGRLFSSETPKPLPGEPWALDNAVFLAWRAKRPWDEQRFLSALNRTQRGVSSGRLTRPLFVTLPDRVADPTSLDYSIRWYERVGHLFVDASHPEIDRPLPWFLVLQNGMRPREVAAVLRSYPFEGVFLGGDDAFKTTAPGWAALAHDLGKRFHFGRVSRIPWLELACEVEADSADTTQFLWSDELFYRLVGAWETLPERCTS